MKKIILLTLLIFFPCVVFSQIYRIREATDVVKITSNGKAVKIEKWMQVSSNDQVKAKFRSGTLSLYDTQTRRVFDLKVLDKEKSISSYISDLDIQSSNVFADFIEYIKETYNQLKDRKYLKYNTIGGSLKGSKVPFVIKKDTNISSKPLISFEVKADTVNRLIIYNPSQQTLFAYIVMETPSDIFYIPLSGHEYALPVPPESDKLSQKIYFSKEDFNSKSKLYLLWSPYMLDLKELDIVKSHCLVDGFVWFEYTL